MKKNLLAVLIAFITLSVSAQDFKGLDNLPMTSNDDFKKAEPTVKECVKYMLSTPSDGNNDNYKSASRFLLKWMTGTPDYSFSIDGDIMKFGKKNDALTVLFMAAAAKAVLDKPELSKDQKALKIATFNLLAEYCNVPKNKIVKTAEIKKLIDAYKKGKVEEVLDMTTVK